jgi:hypothetical protein
MGDAGDIAETKPGDARRFAAFISYSHADANAAAKLQRRLERYRLPKRIAEARAYTTAALGPIFRDREDLAAAASLSAAIRDAIGRADALVVICSPDAAASPWVAAEIALFRRLHPESPILAALLSGEPAASFPAALTANGNEPLAADLRAQGDGEQLGFLKIVAGIAGVPLDTLIQRDAQRRIRRVTAITAGALAAMLIMSIMTALALQARNEAARQRAEAEGLVEFMLTDLRGKLKEVGRLDVMDAVNARAMVYYRSQANMGNLPDDSLDRRARLLQAMGEDSEAAGDVEAALTQFREAHRITEAMLLRVPDDQNRIFAHAQSEYWIGEALLRQNKLAEVGRHFMAYRKLAGELTKRDPQNLKWLRESGYANGNLCTLKLENRSKSQDAVVLCEEALTQMKTVLQLQPGDRTARLDVANRYAWLADARKANADLAGALQARLEQAKIIASLASENPADMGLKEIALKSELMLAEAMGLNGLSVRAKERLIAAKKLYAQLVQHDPANRQWIAWQTKIAEVAEAIKQRQ